MPSGMPTQTTTCQRTGPLTYHGHCSPAAAPLLTPASPALREQVHVGAGRLTRKRLSFCPPPRACSLRSLQGSLCSPAGPGPRSEGGILANLEPSGSARARLPRLSGPHTIRPRGPHLRGEGPSIWGTLACHSELTEEFSRSLLSLQQKNWLLLFG